MPEPLDPTDAIYGAFANTIIRVVSFVAVGVGGHLVGEQILAAPDNLAALKSQGFAAIPAMLSVDVSAMPVGWIGTLIASLAGWTFFYPIVVVALFASALRDGDMFSILFVLALAQPVDTFLIGVKYGALGGMELAYCTALLIVFEIATAALILWWHRTHDALPVETKPEMDEL